MGKSIADVRILVSGEVMVWREATRHAHKRLNQPPAMSGLRGTTYGLHKPKKRVLTLPRRLYNDELSGCWRAAFTS